MTKIPPFDKDYVLRVTDGHIQAAIRRSLSKCVDRLADFREDPVKTFEIMQTITALQEMQAKSGK